MKYRGLFGFITAIVAGIGASLRMPAHGSPTSRLSNGRQAFYAVSAPRRANQRKNYAKGWAK